MKLDSKYVVPYLLYSLKVIMEGKITNIAWVSTKNISVIKPNSIGDIKKINWKYAHLNIKLVLRPLSDLMKDEFKMDDLSKKAVLFLDKTANLPYNNRDNHIGVLRYSDVQFLLKNHFDIFGLIPQGLAVDVNTLK